MRKILMIAISLVIAYFLLKILGFLFYLFFKNILLLGLTVLVYFFIRYVLKKSGYGKGRF